MTKIKDLPVSEMPRERLISYGVENLSDADLISIIIRTGTKNNNVKEISQEILKSVKSINNLSKISIRELSKIKGVGNIKAITLLASIELGKRVYSKKITPKMKLNNSYLIHETFKHLFKSLDQEKFYAIYLDTKKCLISYKLLFIGTCDKALIHPRDIFNEAIKQNASSIVVIHNHPSGSILPSNEDIIVTKKLKESGNIIGIPLIDHIITNGEECYSFYEDEIKTI